MSAGTTDMSDQEWAVVLPLLPVPGWMRGQLGLDTVAFLTQPVDPTPPR